MIRFMHGNLFESEAQALVNTVNCVGVMGKGIAYQFRRAFPASCARPWRVSGSCPRASSNSCARARSRARPSTGI